MKAEALRLDGELSAANDRIDDLERRNDTLTANNQQLVADSTRLFMSYTDLQQRYQQLLACRSLFASYPQHPNRFGLPGLTDPDPHRDGLQGTRGPSCRSFCPFIISKNEEESH